MSLHQISIVINGKKHSAEVSADLSLVDFIRENLDLIGTKKGCNMGDCGACTVLLDGNAINSCLLLAIQADGHEITTIEGLSNGDALDPIQKAFIDHGAVQCGFCTPGMILTAKSLLNNYPKPTRQQIAQAISGNLCRCTGYVQILDAIHGASTCEKYND